MRANLQDLDEVASWLDAQFPLRNPTPSQSHADLMYEAGKRYVVEHFKRKVEELRGDATLTVLTNQGEEYVR